MRALPLIFLTLAACSLAAKPTEETRKVGPSQTASPAPLLSRPTGPLLDAAKIITAKDEAALDARLRAIHGKTGHAITVVTVASLNGDNIDDYTLKLFNRWGVGGVKPGVVLLVATSEKKVRITTGRGLEAKLPDDLCAAIIQRLIIPQFRRGHFVSGIDAGVDALAEHLS